MTAKTERMTASRRLELREYARLYNMSTLIELLDALESAYRELDALTEAARPFSEVEFFTGSDGLVGNWDADTEITAVQGDRLRFACKRTPKWSHFKALADLISPAVPEKEDERA